MRLSTWTLPVLLLLGAIVPASPAGACYNSTLPAVDDSTWESQKAEKALALGDYVQAVQRVRELFPDITVDVVPPGRADLFSRCRRIVAVALARSDGAVVPATMTREAALAWAAKLLRARLHVRPDEPARKSDLAEVLARIPSDRQAAYELLAELAQADLMPEPRGWAVLGAVAGALGRTEVARFATDHCRRLASQGWICDVPPLDAPPPSSATHLAQRT